MILNIIKTCFFGDFLDFQKLVSLAFDIKNRIIRRDINVHVC